MHRTQPADPSTRPICPLVQQSLDRAVPLLVQCVLAFLAHPGMMRRFGQSGFDGFASMLSSDNGLLAFREVFLPQIPLIHLPDGPELSLHWDLMDAIESLYASPAWHDTCPTETRLSYIGRSLDIATSVVSRLH